MVRRYGPVLGAGVAVVEKQAERLIEAAPLGVTLYVTPLEKGATDELISSYSKKDMQRKVGGRIVGYDGPDCAHDFWDHSEGAGELHFLRVTDGTERVAALDIWSREMTSDPDGYTASDIKGRPVMRVEAKNGGRWASQKRTIHRSVALISDVGVTTLTTGLTMLQDEWVGGYVKLDAVSSKVYTIVANSTAGVVTVSPDSDMDADVGVATDTGYQLVLETKVGVEGLNRHVQVMLGDGEQNPSSEFSFAVYVNGTQVKRWPDLSMDPAHKRYFVRIINDDQTNYEVEVTDLLTPSDPSVAARRPANHNGIIASTTATVLTSKLFQWRRTVGVSNPTVALGATTDVMMYPDTLEIECTSVTAGAGTDRTLTCKSVRIGGNATSHAAVTAAAGAGVPFAFTSPTNPLIPPFTVTSGATDFSLGDKFRLDYMPWEPNALVGGTVCPDIVNKPNARYVIAENDHKTLTIQAGDLTDSGGDADADDRFVVFYPQGLGGIDRLNSMTGTTLTATNGTDGLAGLGDTDYTDVHLNAIVSKARKLLTENKGLVKVATPDNTATAVVQAGLAFAEAMNWQYRVEIPDSVTDESSALAHINTTIGRSDFGVTILPSYADVSDPERPGQLKRTPITGMVHGREALMAKTWGGYHKAASGTEVSLPKIVATPMALTLNEEVLNPQGINVVRKSQGKYIIWGNRTIAVDPTWKFKHHREYMSHVECRLRDSYDFIIFALNNEDTQNLLITSLRQMFEPDYRRGALTGNTFEDACHIKIDEENNTPATRADGDLNADIELNVVDCVERFVINISKQGISDNVSA